MATKIEKLIPSAHCGHKTTFIKNGHRLSCSDCFSFFDIDYAEKKFTYESSYATNRNHFSNHIGNAKIRTLWYWLRRCNLVADVIKSNICEVGFGGGQCLLALFKKNINCCGIEITQSTIDHAVKMGISSDNLFLVNNLDSFDKKIDLWIFQDSFEHLDEPNEFMTWLKQNTSKNGKILIVAPEAHSLSDRVMGKNWPHKLPDHRWHWSKRGIVSIMQQHGFQVDCKFYPIKWVSILTLINHLCLLLGIPQLRRNIFYDWIEKIHIPFNFGQFGFVFKSTDTSKG